MTKPVENRVCDNCGRWVDEEELMYCAKLEVWAEAQPPDIDLDKTGEELQKEWNDLFVELKAIEQEL